MPSTDRPSPLDPTAPVVGVDAEGAVVHEPRRTSDPQAALRMAGDENALARLALEHLPGTYVTILDADLRLVSVSAGTVASGVPASRLVGRRVLDVLQPGQAEQLGPSYVAALTGEVGRVRFHQAETATTFDLTVGPLRDAGEAIVGIVVVGHDVTEQATAERRLATQHERFIAAFDTAPLPMAILGADQAVPDGQREAVRADGSPARPDRRPPAPRAVRPS